MPEVRRRPRALLLGDRDVAEPLWAAGVDVTAVAERDTPVRFSRYTSEWLPDPRPDEGALVELLLERASSAAEAVALFYQSDEDLLLVSRRRAELSRSLRFVVAEAPLVEQLVDKSAFQLLAARLDLPVPPARVLRLPPKTGDLTGTTYPVIVKPLRREHVWQSLHGREKALLVQSHAELERLAAALATNHDAILLQQPIDGDEDRIESYHVYVDHQRRVVGEFTGRKVRTLPRQRGESTAVMTTCAPDVREVGREVIDRLGLTGVAKLDMKRDSSGRLWLLEVNPRFNLWHRVGAAAGVNLPALVLADLLDRPRPQQAGTARAGVTWCRVQKDWHARGEQGLGTAAWLRWLRRCDAHTGLDPRDPLPLLALPLLGAARRVLPTGATTTGDR